MKVTVIEVERPCPECGTTEKEPCGTCRGSGFVHDVTPGVHSSCTATICAHNRRPCPDCSGAVEVPLEKDDATFLHKIAGDMYVRSGRTEAFYLAAIDRLVAMHSAAEVRGYERGKAEGKTLVECGKQWTGGICRLAPNHAGQCQD